MKINTLIGFAAGTLLSSAAVTHAATTVTIGTVNNADMIVMQKLSSKFEEENPDIKLDWVVLEENVLRQRLTTDIATGSGQFDVVTIGTYEVPIWGGKAGWCPWRACRQTTTWTMYCNRCATACPTRASCMPCRSTPKVP